MTMKITINKQDFDDAILVATSSNPEVFNLVRPHFSNTYIASSGIISVI